MTTDPNTAWQQHFEAGERAIDDQRWPDAEAEFRSALAVAETFGEQDDRLWRSLDALADICAMQDKRADAEPLHLRVFAIREKLLGHDHKEVIDRLQMLAYGCRRTGRYADSESFALRILALRQNAHGPSHLSVAEALDDLVWAYLGQRKLTQAIAHSRTALAIREAALGRHPTVANDMVMLAGLMSARRRG